MNRLLNKIQNKRLILPAVLVAVVAVIATISGSPASAFYSASSLANKLPAAQSLITGKEAHYQDINSTSYANCPSKSKPSQRTCLNNGGGAYWRYVWISPRNNPDATSSTFPSTVKTVDLQLNIFQFLTAATASKTTSSTVGLGTINYDSNAPNYVKNTTYPADRYPATGQPNAAAQDIYRVKVSSIKVVSVNGVTTGDKGSISGFTSGSVMSLVKDGGSRYWFGNRILFTYNAANEWPDARNKVQLRFTYRSINRYNGSTWQCGNGVSTSDGNYKCGDESADYYFTFIVTPVWILSPKIDNVPTVASVGESITPSLAVNNTGRGYSEDTYWAVSAMVYDRNTPVPTAETLSNNNGSGPTNVRTEKPCQHFQSLGATSCTTEQASPLTGGYKTGVSFPELSETAVPGDHTISVRNYPVGTKVCYALSIYSRDNGTIDQTLFPWAHSAPKCLIVGKKPKVQVTGSDLIVGTGSATAKNVNTASSQKAISGVQKVFGSWVEYGIAATGTVTATASGAGYSTGGSTVFCAASLLTFSNLTGSPPSCASGTIGKYKSTKSLPNIASRLATSKSNPINGGSFDVGAAANSLKGVYSSPERTADLRVTSSAPIAKGNWAVIYVPKAKVVIGSNIDYTTDPMTKASEIPQVLIIADSIDIEGGVGKIDSWLIATGANGIINTCNDVALSAPLTVNICNTTKLVVNGPVVSKQLHLRRTIGSEVGPASGDPAEVFNLRPDAYLWATEWSSAAGRLQTVYTKELPPRF